MPDWRSREHLEDHYWQHRHECPRHSVLDYDASAQETMAIGVEVPTSTG